MVSPCKDCQCSFSSSSSPPVLLCWLHLCSFWELPCVDTQRKRLNKSRQHLLLQQRCAVFESVTSTNELDWSTEPKGGLAYSATTGKQQVSRTFHRTTGRSRQSSFSSYGICQGMISGIIQRQQDIRHNNYRRTIPLLFWNSLILNWFFFSRRRWIRSESPEFTIPVIFSAKFVTSLLNSGASSSKTPTSF